MTAPRFSRFTTRLRQLPVRIARRSLVCENSRISIPSLPQIVYLTEWSREPEPRALLPRVADPSATTHGAETSGAPVLGATPDGDRRATTPAARHCRHALGSMACASPWTNDCLRNVSTSKDHKETIRAAPRASVGLSSAFHPRAREVAVPGATHRGIRELDVVHSSSIDRTRIDADSSAPTPSWDIMLSRTAARAGRLLVAGRSPRHGAADRLAGTDASSGHP